MFYSRDGDLEYDFVVTPGADPKKTQLAFEGTTRMRLDDHSVDLILTTGGGHELRQVRPKMYRYVKTKRLEVVVGYQLLGGERAAFTVWAYDRQRLLVIDPTVSFARTFGGSDSDTVSGVAVDSNGNRYVTGETRSHDFAVIDGSKWLDCNPQFSGFCFGPVDIVVAKLSPTGAILFSTFGGAGFGTAIAVDSTGVYVTGGTFAQRLPGPPNSHNHQTYSSGSYLQPAARFTVT